MSATASSAEGGRISARRSSGPSNPIPPSDDASYSQYRSPSFSNINGLSQLTRSSSSSAVAPARPPNHRSVSGSAETGHFSGFTTTASPSATPSDGPAEDPLAVANNNSSSSSSNSGSNNNHNNSNANNKNRAMTASPSVFGMSKLDQSAWSDSSGANASATSSAWTGRSSGILGGGTADSDVGGTATTSNVSTPGRAPTVGPNELTTGPAGYPRSPLLSADGVAWPNPRGTASTLGWPNDLASSNHEFILEAQTSPSMAKEPVKPSALQRQTTTASSGGANVAVIRGSEVSSPEQVRRDPLRTSTLTSDANRKPSTTPASEGIISSSDAATPLEGALSGPRESALKRVPQRSSTLDPGHLASHIDKRKELEPQHSSNLPEDIGAGVRGMSLREQFGETPYPGQQMGPVPESPRQHHGQGPMGQLPMFQHSPQQHQFGHAQRPSFAYGYPQQDSFVHPTPFYPGASRSPEPYTAYGQGMPAIDMSGYESYRTTPDPYAPPPSGRPMYATPGPPPPQSSSHGSTPQSPQFGPSGLPQTHAPIPLRGQAEGILYGTPGGYGHALGLPPMSMQGRPPPPPLLGGPNFSYGPGARASMTPGPSPGPVQSLMMPGPSPPPHLLFPPQSPLIPGGMGGDKKLVQQQHHSPAPMLTGGHRRMGSHLENVGPGLGGRGAAPPGAYGPAAVSQGQVAFNYSASLAQGWNNRMMGHRRIPTGPGGVMAPPMSYHGPMGSESMGPAGGFIPPSPGSYYGGVAPAPPVGARSPLLEEFRGRHAKSRRFELRDILGSIVEFSSDQHGSRFIQEKLDSATEEEKDKVFDELLPSARQLMTDVFGNYVIQKMFEHGSEPQRSILAKEMEGHILSLSLGTYGCRVVQKAFEHTTDEQRVTLAKELSGHVLQCVKDQNANHVVQKVIERVDPSEIDFIPQAFRGQVLSLAAHCYSCRVLQRIFEHCHESQSRPLLDELHGDVLRLMQDQYGNYVIQWVLQKGQARDREEVIGKIKGQVLALSRHKFASNVIEEVIRTADPDNRAELVEEILTPKLVNEGASAPGPRGATTSPPQAVVGPDGETAVVPPSPNQAQKIAPAVIMMKDQFANYVLQRFLEVAQGEQRARLIAAVRPQLISMRRYSNGYAKHLAAIEKLIEERPGDVQVPKPNVEVVVPA
ncbi:ARM repeat-containing protein [Violaceomyces palustris]|uniref:ARM repeat-containing protein n=1 Tax=Violaceomyces palustris TaxID=1673888 RepID=A0ACD0NY34_9BASI|nr:ARM repeat-containing protein [Violaceomyces palustris]